MVAVALKTTESPKERRARGNDEYDRAYGRDPHRSVPLATPALGSVVRLPHLANHHSREPTDTRFGRKSATRMESGATGNEGSMIDFQNATFVKLAPADPNQYRDELGPLLVPGEEFYLAFTGIRDSVLFTNKRLISINVQGLTGKKRDYTSLPYSKIQAFSVETAGRFDRDVELDLWFSGLGRVRLEFKGNVEIQGIGRLVGEHML